MEEGAVYTDIHDAIEEYYSGTLTKYTIWDFSNMKKKHLASEDAIKLGQLVNAAGKARKGGFDIIVVPGLVQYGMARIYAAYAAIVERDEQNLCTKIFRNLDEALLWIQKNYIST